MLKKLSAKFTRILGTPAAGRRKRRTVDQVTPAIESLEKRLLPTVSVVANGAEAMLVIEGTNGNDTVAVSQSGHGFLVTENGTSRTVGSHIHSNGMMLPVTQILFRGHDGHDRFQNNTSLRLTAHGNAGNDTLFGGYGADILHGDAGNDQLFALGDAWVDQLYGGADNDYMIGSQGSDNMYGGAGSDTMIGGGGDDVLYGDSGADFLYGQFGDDELDGGDDGFADYLNGGAGADRFQMEGYGNPDSMFTAYYNLDDPADYNSAEGDSFFGADTPLKTRYTYFGNLSLYSASRWSLY